MKNVNEEESAHVACLLEQGFTRGLAHAVYRNCKEAFALRFWVVDNSGSMNQFDGCRLMETNKKNRVIPVQCTRWDELKDCVKYHAQMAALLVAPTKFIFLNPPVGTINRGLPQSYGVAEMGQDMVEEELESLFNCLNDSQASGVTPLAQRLNEIYQAVAPLKASLLRDGQQVVVVLATDGLPTDDRGYTGQIMTEQFEHALHKLLRDLPVWMVIRLCTDEVATIEYYEKLDSQLELNIEVLDDYEDEAKEVEKYNSWLNYGLSLHRCREMGFRHRLLDILDERALTLDEVCEFLRLQFGSSVIKTDPHGDWDTFVKELKTNILAVEDKTYHPLRKRLKPWIDLRQLKRSYGPTNYLQWFIMVSVILLAIFVKVVLLRQPKTILYAATHAPSDITA